VNVRNCLQGDRAESIGLHGQPFQGFQVIPEVLAESCIYRKPLTAFNGSGQLHATQSAFYNRIHIVHGTEKPRDSLYGLLLARVIGARKGYRGDNGPAIQAWLDTH